jgi:uncharacterized protein YbjT (DUF2867 family)
MQTILITGATGNIGREVIESLVALNVKAEIITAVRDIAKAKDTFMKFTHLSYRSYDFENPQTFKSAFKDVNTLFLLRPPHISKVDIVFRPLLEIAKSSGIERIIFLSVQGAEKSKLIPHNRIELLIKEFGFDYIFVRPSYFMQNLTTALRDDIAQHQRIILPSKEAPFNWVDVKDIGLATAHLIQDFATYKNQAFEITGSENLNFKQVADELSRLISKKVEFQSINPFRFYFKKKREGLNHSFALVMTLLHFLPRIQEPPEITNDYMNITGREPTTLREFIQREKNAFLP